MIASIFWDYLHLVIIILKTFLERKKIFINVYIYEEITTN